MITDPETWLTENEIVEAVAEHLKRSGWEIKQTSNTTQHGVDILAARGEFTLAIEAKGGGSSKPGSHRYGMPFDAKQKRTHVAVAVLAALGELSRGQHRAALAFPDDPRHLGLIEEIWPTLQKLGIDVYFVGPDKSVRLGMNRPS